VLGIRLSADAEARLERHARETGRPKSMIARDWIVERLDREEVDGRIRGAAALHAAGQSTAERNGHPKPEEDDILRWLDDEDGGYDWGPSGPPDLS